VGVCVHCGRAVCKACASEADGGRLVCSRQCAESLGKGPSFAVGCFFLLMGGGVVVWSVRMFTIRAGELPIITLMLAFVFLLVGAILVSQEDLSNMTFEPFYRIRGEIRWRAGIALRTAHRYRKSFGEMLLEYAELTGENITFSQLEWAGRETRLMLLDQICKAAAPFPDWVAKSPHAAAAEMEEQIALAHAIGWTYFADKDYLSNSFETRSSILLDVISLAHKLDSNFTLGVLRENLIARAKSEAKGQPSHPCPSL
jgi:hypothetical protein